MTKPVILTGVRANSDIHIGNYFGGILPTIDMARHNSAEYDVNMFIPDLHSFTTPIDHSQLQNSIMNNARLYVAAGLPLDNDSIQLYRQSYISAHSELTVILNNFVGFGEMERMTQFKDKSAKLGSERVSVGLFDYPVLMISDILLYHAKYVPVGDDQTQHLEITRDVAERVNKRFGELFTVPASVRDQHAFFGKDQGLRIKDLQNPAKKMSKSDDTGKGVIFMNELPNNAHKKIMSATTDSLGHIAYDKIAQPGISNLLEILTLVRQAKNQKVSLQDTIDEFAGSERYGDFKKIIADETTDFLREFQVRLSKVDDKAILKKLERSEAAMSRVAGETLFAVQKAVGLRA